MERSSRASRPLWGEPLLAWVALAAGVIAVCGHSASAYSLPVLMKAITAELGWSRGEFARAFATRTIGIGLSGVVWGLLTDRAGARMVLVAGALICGIGLVRFATMGSITDLYVAGLVTGVGIGGLGPIAASALVARRFGPRRAIALGVLHAGDNILSSFLPTTTARLAGALGWRGATGVLAAAYLGVAAIVLACLAGGREDTRSERRDVSLAALPWTDPALGLVSLSFLFAYAYIGAVMYHFVAYQTDLGLPEAFATRAMGNLVLAGFGGALGAGWLAGRMRAGGALVLAHGLLCLASVGLWLGPDERTFRAWPWLHGFAMGAYGPLLPLVLTERWGAEAPYLGTLIGAVSLLGLVGAYLGNLAGGLGHDLAQTYAPVWQGFSIALLATLAFPVALRRQPAAH